MACALGLADSLVGVTHECDYPAEVQVKPVVVRSVLPLETMTQPEIDAAVSARLRDGQSLYQVDEDLLRRLKPDLIMTQDLCQVCAPSGNELSQALKTLDKEPQVLSMTPNSLEGIEGNVRDLGRGGRPGARSGRLDSRRPRKVGQHLDAVAERFGPAACVLHGVAGSGLLQRPLGARDGAYCRRCGSSRTRSRRFRADRVGAGSQMGPRNLRRYAVRVPAGKGGRVVVQVTGVSGLVRTDRCSRKSCLCGRCEFVLRSARTACCRRNGTAGPLVPSGLFFVGRPC